MKKPNRLHGTVHRLAHTSMCLKDNLLGDPFEREIFIYTPPGYGDDNTGRYPVVMLLPGFAATHHSIVGWDPFKPNTVELFETLVLAGKAPPALLVMPDCVNRWGGSQFLDSPATGRYQTYLADEIIPFVNDHFRTIPTRDGWAVAGRSSGGFGALRLGMARPDLVSVLGTHAGDAAFEVSMRPMLTPAAIAIAQAGGLAAFAEAVLDGGPKGPGAFDAIFVLACCAAYAPEIDVPCPHLELPVDLATGALREGAWARWIGEDPVTLLADSGGPSATAMSKMSLVYVDAGDRDEHGLHYAARELTRLLSAAGANVTSEEFPGGHRGTSFRYGTSLPAMLAALATG